MSERWRIDIEQTSPNFCLTDGISHMMFYDYGDAEFVEMKFNQVDDLTVERQKLWSANLKLKAKCDRLHHALDKIAFHPGYTKDEILSNSIWILKIATEALNHKEDV